MGNLGNCSYDNYFWRETNGTILHTTVGNT
jgi:hypothetical protein